jgi:hypothetical protein
MDLIAAAGSAQGCGVCAPAAPDAIGVWLRL